MAKKSKNQAKEPVEQEEQIPVSEEITEETPCEEAPVEEAPKEPTELEKALADKAAEHERYLLLAAEYDNYRKRTQKEKDGMFADGIVKATSSILPVIDNLERALMAETADAEFKGGVELIKKQFITALESLGIKEIDCQGKEFDPKLHNAIMHIDDEQYGENEVIEVFQKGYVYKEDTIIRHAIVKVAN